ncbi:acyl carrier protein [Paenibacillus agilis]|uniref:Acyl carrier protein n=1 Tax=Paenibacillus agilis TaxID=3020863 RepID=A0A559J145_9BACL|nr:phosphopantetheine-binding protein [Paenibacillus agilis]TVX93566.1 acyl carrier protein [Paenibacillus agilis]
MEKEMIIEEIKEMLRSGLASSTITDEIHEDTSLLRDVGLDSVQLIELVVVIEAKLDLPIFNEDLNASLFDRFGSLVDFIHSKLLQRQV